MTKVPKRDLKVFWGEGGLGWEVRVWVKGVVVWGFVVVGVTRFQGDLGLGVEVWGIIGVLGGVRGLFFWVEDCSVRGSEGF